MLKKILLCFYLLAALPVLAQQPADKINLSSINFSLIDKLFNEKLAALRATKSASPLTADATLKKAAQDQADFMNANDTLTHFQPAAAKKTPADRVLFYNGHHDGVGENCLFIFLQLPITVKNKKEPVLVNTYADAAEQIFQSWKNSPGHYKNMIDPKYDVQAIAFSYNPKTQKVYASQVFAMKPYNYPPKLNGLLSEYSIKPYNESACKVIKEENVGGIRVANRIYVQDNKVYIALQQARKFTHVFKDPNDMLAIDVVFKDQFGCEKSNRLNGSPYYDGVLLKPVTFAELYKRNTGINGRLQSYICDLPPEVRGTNYQLNVVLIKNSCFCSYTYPVRIESQEYSLINLEPYWDTVPVHLKSDTFNLVIKQKIKFDKSKSEIDQKSLLATQEKLKLLGRFATSVKLNAYSSVEGDEKINKAIQEKRAAVILQQLSPFFPKTVHPQIVAKENWDMFNNQVKMDYFRYLLQFDQPRIKLAIKDSLQGRLEKFLSEERYAEFEIRMEGAYSDTSNTQVLSLALLRALQHKDLQLAYEIQSKLIYRYLNGKATIDDLSSYDFPPDSIATPFAVNLLAAKAINPNDDAYANTKLMRDLFKRFGSNKKAQYNFCIYAINYWATTGDTLINPDRLMELVNKCKTMAPESAVNSMLLNYHLAAVSYYGGLVNDFDRMVNNLEAIHTLFSTVKLSENTSYKLALYFADYNAIDWVAQLLEPYMAQTKDERVMHLYLVAGAVVYQKDLPKAYTDALDRYVQLFPAGYKKWIGDEYQLLREPAFKSRYCK